MLHRGAGRLRFAATVFFAGLVLVVAAVAAGFPPHQQPARRVSAPNVPEALQRYEDGEYDAAVADVAATADLDLLRQRLNEHGKVWVTARASAQARRRLILASVALEAAAANLEQWRSARHLVEWGCELLRDGGKPTAGERQWHLAAVALIEEAYDWVFLVGVAPYQADWDSKRGKAANHLRHAEGRFPDEDRFRLARAVAEEMKAYGPGDSRHPVWVDPRDTPAREWPPRLRFPADEAERVIRLAALHRYPPPLSATHSIALWRVAQQYHDLLARPAVAPEAHLRLGFTYLRLGRMDLAEPELAAAIRLADDVFVRYLGYCFIARMRSEAGDGTEAISAYRSALDLVPRAQSAALPLAALLAGGPSREEAFELVAGALRPPLVPDPWRLYGAGDARRWSALATRLREATR